MFEQKLNAERAKADKLQADLIHISRVSAMDAMSSAIAHELNQPLTSIMNLASIIAMIAATRSDSKELETVAHDLQKGAYRAAEILRRLRAMTMRGDVEKVSVALADCVREAAALALTGSSTQIGYDIPPDLHVWADRIQLQQVIVNLVRNAAEATAGLSGARIDIEARQEGDLVCLTVKDNGTGIPADVLPTIFDSFRSTKPGGMGVGLAISRTIVETHGGRLTVETAEGEGSAFEISLPGS
jgi:two-component system, LuxR family, sensor kinase FixL